LNRRRFLTVSAASAVPVTVVVRGSAATDQPIEIEDWHDLDAVRDNRDEDYILVSDLDAQTAGYDEHVGDPEEGWMPIVYSDSGRTNNFTGTFDGQGHEIADLEIHRPDTRGVGIFANNRGTIENVMVTGAEVTGRSHVGALVGQNRREVAASAVCNADISAKNLGVGALVEDNSFKIANSSVRDVTVSGEGNVGRIIGSVTGRATVTASSVRASNLTGEKDVGGLVGWHGGDIENSGAVTDVTGEENVGGLVGKHIGEVVSSWAAGAVAGDENVGGLVGSLIDRIHGDGTVTAGYWDTEATGQESGIGDADGDVTGYTTDELQGASAEVNMTELDFEETWVAQSYPDDYPQLRWQADSADDDWYGLGVAGAVAGIGAIGYLLNRRLADDEPECEQL